MVPVYCQSLLYQRIQKYQFIFRTTYYIINVQNTKVRNEMKYEFSKLFI